jgi:hypothetical protein
MTRSDVKQSRAFPSSALIILWFTTLSVPLAIAAYYRIFSGFAEWDDEGTLMMTVKQYLTGSKLYDEIYSGYGPVYYFYNWLIRSVTGNVLDHDAVRITAAVVALICGLLCAGIVLRLTQSLAIASVVYLLVFRTLAFFTYEPGHPQELCLLLLICLAGKGTLAESTRFYEGTFFIAGALAAALTLTKVNIGIFVVAGIVLWILFQAPDAWFWRLARYGAGAGALILPVMLMRVHLSDPASQAYCFVATASIAGILVASQGFAGPKSLSLRECLITAAGFAVTFAVLLLILIGQGVTMRATLNSLVLNHIRINVSPGYWYKPVQLSRIWMAWSMAGLGAAIVATRALARRESGIADLLAGVRIAFGGIGILLGFVVPDFLLGFATPFCWLLLLPRTDHDTAKRVDARMLLCTVTVLQTLYAFPIAGSQTYFIRVLLVLAAAISLMDGLHGLSQTSPLGAMFSGFARPAAAITLVVTALACPLLAYRANRLYASLAPLNLPGAERIHVERRTVEDYQWLVTQLRRNCDTFVSLPGIPSLYFWTDKPMPGEVHHTPGQLNFNMWMDMFTSAQQKEVVADLARFPSVCAVYHPSGVESWNTGKQNVRGWPLANHILTNFKTIGRSGDYQFMVPNERQLDIPPGVRHEASSLGR